MLVNVFLILLTVLLLGAVLFFAWIGWGTFFYGVPLVPTCRKVARKMIELADLHKGQKVYDLGCGTGTILFEINPPPLGHELEAEWQSPLNRGEEIRCVGCDLVRPAIWYAKVKNFFLRKNVKFECADFFEKDLSDADVIFCYLFRSVMDRFYTKKWDTLKFGCRVVSHGFPIEKLKPIQIWQEGKVKIYVYEKN